MKVNDIYKKALYVTGKHLIDLNCGELYTKLKINIQNIY